MRRHPLAAAAVDLDAPPHLAPATIAPRPQTLPTRSGNPPEHPEINWRAVRRIGAGGLLLLAVVIGGGSWLLLRAGVEPQTITVLGILLLFIGAIGLTAAVELCKKRKS